MQKDLGQSLRWKNQIIFGHMGTCELDQASAQSAAVRQIAQAQRQRSMLFPFIGRSSPFQAWQHYPRNDAVDTSGAWQFYYHAHDASQDGGARHPQEHGHIHVFRRSPTGQLSHLTGLALDARGIPLAWFSTNQWVTGERWRAARPMVQGLRTLYWQVRGPLAGVALWIADLIRAYAAPLSEMLVARDEALASHCSRHQISTEQAWKDRSISVWSSFPIDWPNDVIALQGQVFKYVK